ncbi:hypothetical protein HD806DRAFT_534031 [Xylariaceae sp. AK1471]|nr:hypothetical protein HD806DRAFT_534031 [Xylariaceae sp. AK1471]
MVTNQSSQQKGNSNAATKLPPVKEARPQGRTPLPPNEYPHSFVEIIKYYSGNDRDLIWGPFYKRFRAARREKANWQDFSLKYIWSHIPEASQTRPNLLQQCFYWATGADAPPPTITPAPPRSRRNRNTQDTEHVSPLESSEKAKRTRDQPIDNWQDEIDTKTDWSPTQIDFSEWYGRFKHPEDYDDDFYRNNYTALYDTICDFAEKWFGAGQILENWRDSAADISVWEVPMTEQFVQYTRAVAHEDRGYINWKDMLSDPTHRKWLCVSIFSQIIERKIFNQLLFGVTEEFQTELDRHDQHWVMQEGFTRKQGRRQIARAALGERLVPADFWDSVDDLAGQTVLIFQPLFTLMCLVTGKTPKDSAAVFWQEAHSIIAMAGYFQVCMTISPSVFHILSATPGARFQWDEEMHADREIYRKSKYFHDSHNDRWRMLADASVNNDQSLVDKLMKYVTNPADIAAYQPLPPGKEEYQIMDSRRRRGGKVMYAVFPKLTRYKAENIGDIIVDVKRPASSQDIQEEGEGTRITILSRCLVVYYQGLVCLPAGQDDGIPLEAHLSQISWNRMLGSILPYRRRYWSADGTATSSLHWPFWPEGIDIFWFWWLFFVAVTQVTLSVYGPPPSGVAVTVWDIFFRKPFSWLALEALLYASIRAYELPWLDGPWLYAKIQGIFFAGNVVLAILVSLQAQNFKLFSRFCPPFMWMDDVLLNKFPSLMMNAAGILRQEDAWGVINHSANAIGRLFGNGAAEQ